MENCLRLVYQLSINSWSNFSFKRFSFIASLSVLWFCGSAAVKMFELILSSSWMIVDEQELLISISGVKCSVSSHSLLVDLCVDISPSFLMTLKEIADWLHLASPYIIYIAIKHELNGIELVRTRISQLVLAVAFSKGFFWNSEFDKDYMTSYMFCFTIMSLVISRVSCFRPAEIRRKGNSMKVFFVC